MAVTSLTRRGRIVLGICVLGAVMALVVGGRSLNAVVVPGVVALVAGYLQTYRIDSPGMARSGLVDGFVGETHEIRVEFHGDAPGVPVDSSFVARVHDRLDEGLVALDGAVRVAVGDEPATYRVGYRDRGGQRLGPMDVTATDVFGLFRKRLVLDATDRVVVYPECHPIPAGFRRELYGDDAPDESRQREEFDRLREYARGDSLRDVHWPATAKHEDIVVKEFAAETERRRVSIAGGTGDRRDPVAADVLARASASLAISLLGDGIPVEVTLPVGRVDAEPGRRGRREVLELAARTGIGTVDDAADADVAIEADTTDARIRANDAVVDFSTLRSSADPVTLDTTAAGAGTADGTATERVNGSHPTAADDTRRENRDPDDVATVSALRDGGGRR